MGEPNNVLNVYMNRPDRIRSVLEYYLGQKIPGDWTFEAGDGFYSVRNAKGKITSRQRDIIKRIRIKGMMGFSFQIGLENQYTVNLTFPWRLMEMDCCAYGADIERIQERNEAGRVKYGAEDDFKYRYRKKDCLEPVLNLTLYWGRGEWKKPLSIGDMTDMEALPEKLRRLVGDYRVHLIHMRRIPEAELQKMDSDLKYVLGLMKRTRSKKKYMEYIQVNREYFSRIPRSAADVIDVCMNIKELGSYLQFKEARDVEGGEEEADMCQALSEIIRDAEKKGTKQGIQQGMKQGIQQGVKQGVKQGIDRTNHLIQRLLADGRQEDLARSVADPLFQKKLFQEYHI